MLNLSLYIPPVFFLYPLERDRRIRAASEADASTEDPKSAQRGSWRETGAVS